MPLPAAILYGLLDALPKCRQLGQGHQRLSNKALKTAVTSLADIEPRFCPASWAWPKMGGANYLTAL